MQLDLFNQKKSNFFILQDQVKKLIELGKKEGRSDNVYKLFQSANLRVKNYSRKNDIDINDIRYRFALNIESLINANKFTSKEIYRKSVELTFK